jgi:pimeloyl-ACP methyl ester carboxylesterase
MSDYSMTRRVVLGVAAGLGASAVSRAAVTDAGALVRPEAKPNFSRQASSGYFTNRRGLKLAYNLSRVSARDIVILAHGFGSDKSADGRFDYIARLLSAAGISAMAFDFAGYGNSDDDVITLEKQVDDLASAIDFVRSLGFSTVALWGNSLGSRVALTVPDRDIRTMILSAACAGPIRYDWSAYLSPEQLAEMESAGRVTMAVNSYQTARRKIVVSRTLIDAFATMDAPRILGAVRCPVLLINGTVGEEEARLAQNSEAAIRHLPRGSRVMIVPGAAHDFNHHLDSVTRAGLDWLAQAGMGAA